MSISPIDVSSLNLNLAQWKGQALASLFDPAASNKSYVPMGGASGDTTMFNRLSNSVLDPAATPQSANLLTKSADFGGMLDEFGAAFSATALATPTTPTGLDSSQPFSKPGQNMVTVLNRVEVSFKAQFSELSQLRNTLAGEQDAAQKLGAIDSQTSVSDITAALDNFVASYNAGVNRFAPDVAQGGILEGSHEAARASFATRREIGNILTGSEVGLKGGLAALGVSVDPKTGLASIDHAQLDSALAQNKSIDVVAIHDFATAFVATVANLNAPNYAQDRQLANLDHAVHWIDDNKAAVQKEFGPGAAATPNEVFAKAAAQYDVMASLIRSS